MTSQDTSASGYEPQYGLRPLLNFLKQARNHYLDQFRSFYENQRKAGFPGEPEALLETDDERLFDKVLVADYLRVGDRPHVVRFEPSRMLSFSPITVTITGMTIVIERLRWDDVVIKSDAPLPSKADLQVWFEDWTTPRDNPEDHHEQLGNVLHSVRFEEDEDGREIFRIDFGSVPPKAVVDLFLLLNESGAKNVRLV